ncbi:hypothetical protein [Haladaptatus pallidirubidus]|nr:hypothetical protein [Haladaptatus pallidirubidus]
MVGFGNIQIIREMELRLVARRLQLLGADDALTRRSPVAFAQQTPSRK